MYASCSLSVWGSFFISSSLIFVNKYTPLKNTPKNTPDNIKITNSGGKIRNNTIIRTSEIRMDKKVYIGISPFFCVEIFLPGRRFPEGSRSAKKEVLVWLDSFPEIAMVIVNSHDRQFSLLGSDLVLDFSFWKVCAFFSSARVPPKSCSSLKAISQDASEINKKAVFF